ncbi:MAG: hypothetical protein JWO80_5637 [Bryobacterales bacterium]|nr:hypothetical protein [Bryobacterales bacterium]
MRPGRRERVGKRRARERRGPVRPGRGCSPGAAPAAELRVIRVRRAHRAAHRREEAGEVRLGSGPDAARSEWDGRAAAPDVREPFPPLPVAAAEPLSVSVGASEKTRAADETDPKPKGDGGQNAATASPLPGRQVPMRRLAAPVSQVPWASRLRQARQAAPAVQQASLPRRVAPLAQVPAVQPGAPRAPGHRDRAHRYRRALHAPRRSIVLRGPRRLRRFPSTSRRRLRPPSWNAFFRISRAPSACRGSHAT